MSLSEDESSAAAVIGAKIRTPTWTNNCSGCLSSLRRCGQSVDHAFSDQLATFLLLKPTFISFHFCFHSRAIKPAGASSALSLPHSPTNTLSYHEIIHQIFALWYDGIFDTVFAFLANHRRTDEGPHDPSAASAHRSQNTCSLGKAREGSDA
jgi:hypothetical protein